VVRKPKAKCQKGKQKQEQEQDDEMAGMEQKNLFTCDVV
jgi:hypothetical protein